MSLAAGGEVPRLRGLRRVRRHSAPTSAAAPAATQDAHQRFRGLGVDGVGLAAQCLSCLLVALSLAGRWCPFGGGRFAEVRRPVGCSFPCFCCWRRLGIWCCDPLSKGKLYRWRAAGHWFRPVPTAAFCWPCRCVVGLNWTLAFRQASGGVGRLRTLVVQVLESVCERCSLALNPRRRWSQLGPLVELVHPLTQVLRAIVFRRLSSSLTRTPWLLLWYWDCSLVVCELAGGSGSC